MYIAVIPHAHAKNVVQICRTYNFTVPGLSPQHPNTSKNFHVKHDSSVVFRFRVWFQRPESSVTKHHKTHEWHFRCKPKWTLHFSSHVPMHAAATWCKWRNKYVTASHRGTSCADATNVPCMWYLDPVRSTHVDAPSSDVSTSLNVSLDKATWSDSLREVALSQHMYHTMILNGILSDRRNCTPWELSIVAAYKPWWISAYKPWWISAPDNSKQAVNLRRL